MKADVSVAVRSPRARVAWVIAGAALLFAILQGGLTVFVPSLGMTTTALLVSAAMLIVAVVIERLVYRRSPKHAVLALGWGRPRRGAVLTAALISIGMLAFFPIYSLATGAELRLLPEWPLVLLGAIALNGLAEETLFRGFVFGHLRQAGQSFRRAAVVSMLIFGAVHLLLFAGNPFVVALLATVLAVAAAVPLAFLYERGGRTIWAGVILHVAGHAFRLVAVPESAILAAGSAWILLQIAAVFVVFVFATTLLKPAALDARVAAASPSS